jgi:hypothetical protein
MRHLKLSFCLDMDLDRNHLLIRPKVLSTWKSSSLLLPRILDVRL